MNVPLLQLFEAVSKDKSLKQLILDTKKEKDPSLAFCQKATELGFPITVGELFGTGEEFYCDLFRSCNGSAVNPIEGWDDAYDMFFAALEGMKE